MGTNCTTCTQTILNTVILGVKYVTAKFCQCVESSAFNNENILESVCTITVYSLVIWLTLSPTSY